MVPTPKTTQSLAELFKSFEDAINGKDLSPEWIEQRGQIVHAISEAMKTHRPSRAADFENYRTFASMLILISTFISHGKAKDYLAGMDGIKIADQMMIAADSARVPAGSTSPSHFLYTLLSFTSLYSSSNSSKTSLSVQTLNFTTHFKPTTSPLPTPSTQSLTLSLPSPLLYFTLLLLQLFQNFTFRSNPKLYHPLQTNYFTTSNTFYTVPHTFSTHSSPLLHSTPLPTLSRSGNWPAGEEQRRINAAQLARGKPRAALAKERQEKRKEGWQTLPEIDEGPIGEIRAARRREIKLAKRPRTRKRGKGPKAQPRWFKDTRPGLSASDDDSASVEGSASQEGSKSPTPRPLIRTQRNSSSVDAANATPSDEDMGETSDEGVEGIIRPVQLGQSAGEDGDASDADAEAEDGEDSEDEGDSEDGMQGSGEDGEDAENAEDAEDASDASAYDSSNSSDSSEDTVEIHMQSSTPVSRTARRTVQTAEDIDEDDPSIIWLDKGNPRKQRIVHFSPPRHFSPLLETTDEEASGENVNGKSGGPEDDTEPAEVHDKPAERTVISDSEAEREGSLEL